MPSVCATRPRDGRWLDPFLHQRHFAGSLDPDRPRVSGRRGVTREAGRVVGSRFGCLERAVGAGDAGLSEITANRSPREVLRAANSDTLL